ncbi:geranylgeranylglyceryl/heptaprenylglyceryl phosphate synthase [Aureitalea sp. L0-47]|uniref:geranylgeranylglyceryl/heptaprenylglyceryl phosphate synthase n=1 Tax=Aureitalea sp. L0-47 TaxID=2816962 RepID=UPI002236FE84|nr:geranylgeranylglyceryl/heptaprenylglyceryl phosphate synthase [Aureitalea sp. L0-47]MCW5518403.1 geranylgeranylglyceryl/heptaprenylglyceryl phosphate synthase [Aureitalea sp. L0-47]
MKIQKTYKAILDASEKNQKLLAVLLDPEKFDLEKTAEFLRRLPSETTHIFVGGSTVPEGQTQELVNAIKLHTSRPVVLFPGDVSQISKNADALLFLSLFSGANPEYLVHQQIKAVPLLRSIDLEVIPTGYILVDGGNDSAVSVVTKTHPISQSEPGRIVDTAVAAELTGKKLIYLEAGSGALTPVRAEIISAVKKELQIPLIVGGGIRTKEQLKAAYEAGADMVVMGTAFETN